MTEGLDLTALLQSGDEITQEQIMSTLISDTNEKGEIYYPVLLRTELPNPRAYACLQIIANKLESQGMQRCADAINDYLQTFIRAMISNQRKSFDSVERMMIAVQENEQEKMTIENKLFGADGK